MKKLSLFDHLNNITLTKSDLDVNDEQSKSYNNYMINRFMSMSEIYIPVVNEINKYELPKDVHHRYYSAVMPKRKYYFKYIKQKKEIDDKTRELLCEYFQCANGEMEYHLQILTNEQIKKIVNLYKHRRSI